MDPTAETMFQPIAYTFLYMYINIFIIHPWRCVDTTVLDITEAVPGHMDTIRDSLRLPGGLGEMNR